MAKHFIFFYFLFVSLTCLGQAKKNSSTTCGHDLATAAQREVDSKAFDDAENAFNKNLELKSKKIIQPNDMGYDYMIPVVVHIVHNGEIVGNGTNISYAQIQSQIDALNAAYSNYSYTNYLGSNVEGQYNLPIRRGLNGVDTRVRFCLANNLGSISSDGTITPGEKGVIRYNNAVQSRHQLSLAGQQSLMNLTHPNDGILNYQNYFNIWVVTSINTSRPGVEGYAPIPVDIPYATNGNWPLRGIVIRSDVFGDNSVNNNNYVLQPNINPSAGGGTIGANFSFGKILIHEMGHALGLYHTFHSYAQNGTDSCDPNFGDLVSDTPPCNISGLATYNGTGTRNTCTESPDSNDMVEDYMYYSTDNVSNTFTNGQKARMASTLDLIYTNLFSERNLMQTGALGNEGCAAPIVTAEFDSPATACANQPTPFSNLNGSGNLASVWHWTVTPNSGVVIGSPNNAATFITFSTAGNYQIQLTATNNSQTKTFTKNILVSGCNLNSCAVENGSFHSIIGNGVHLDWRTGTPVLVNDVFNSPDHFYSVECNFAQSDKNGNLLFYTDGNWVWNAQHQRINVWNPLSPFPVNGGQTTRNSGQGIMAVAYPSHPNQYILLLPPQAESYGAAPFGTGSGTFKYAIINMTPGNESVSNNFDIYSTITPKKILEQIAIIPHCNGLDYWVLIMEAENASNTHTSKMYSYLLSSAGIKLVDTFTFGQYLQYFPTAQHGTILSTNRTGEQIVVTFNDFIKVMDFNNTNGTFSNERNLLKAPPTGNYEYDAILSPSGNNLFVRNVNTISLYNVTSTNIVLRTNNIYTETPPSQSAANYFRRMFLGPDNEIYFPEKSKTMANCFAYGTSTALSRINNPDSQSPTVTASLITFNTTNACQTSMGAAPNTLPACKPAFEAPDFTITKIDCNKVKVTLNGCFNQYSVTIDWGDGSSPTSGLFTDSASNLFTHNYNQSGVFTISVTLKIDSRWATTGTTLTSNSYSLSPVTKQVTIVANEAALIGAAEICKTPQAFQYVFNAGLSGMYAWEITGTDNQILGPSSGSGLNTVDVIWNNGGTIKITYTEGTCTLEDEIAINFYECGSVGTPGCTLRTSPNPVIDKMDIVSENNIYEVTVYNVLGQLISKQSMNISHTELNLSSLQAGTYFLKINACNKDNIIKILKN